MRARNAKHETKTDRNGRFELVGLPSGDYTVEAKLPLPCSHRYAHGQWSVGGSDDEDAGRRTAGNDHGHSDDGSVTASRQSGKRLREAAEPRLRSGVSNGVGGTSVRLAR